MAPGSMGEEVGAMVKRYAVTYHTPVSKKKKRHVCVLGTCDGRVAFG